MHSTFLANTSRAGRILLLWMLASALLAAQQPPPVMRITLNQALRLAEQHNPTYRAVETTVAQSRADEITASLRPNPVLSWDALYIPVFSPHAFSWNNFNNTQEYDAGVTYTFERGGKRQARMRAARNATTVVRDQVRDSARGLQFAVAQAFAAALLAKDTLAFSQRDLASFQKTVSVSQARFQAGDLSKGDLLKIHLQLLQFQTDVDAARMSYLQALDGLRQLMGFSAVPANYDVAGHLQFQPLHGNQDDYENLAIKNRPDLAAARAAVAAAKSDYLLAKADGKRDLNFTAQYMHSGGLNQMGFLWNIEIPVFDRNQGEIARTAAATTQAEDQAQAANQAVLTDVRTAYQAVETGSRVVRLYDSGYLKDAAQSLKISRYAFQHGGASLLDLLDAERSYRSTELSYRQALATYMLAVEQLKEAVGTRNLP